MSLLIWIIKTAYWSYGFFATLGQKLVDASYTTDYLLASCFTVNNPFYNFLSDRSAVPSIDVVYRFIENVSKTFGAIGKIEREFIGALQNLLGKMSIPLPVLFVASATMFGLIMVCWRVLKKAATPLRWLD